MLVFSSSPLSAAPRFRTADNKPVVIGLVNNMADAALRTTELQFRSLLAVASGNIPVCLRLFYLPELPREGRDRSLVDRGYEEVSELWAAQLDGLIVTGTEPRAPALIDEPFWPTLTKLVDWAEVNTFSTIWSCLAAHAAVLHIDGIGRRTLGKKLSGIFDCRKAENHTILVGAPSRWRVPHSRYNGLSEEALASGGYCLLSRSPDAGADMFVKHRKSLFIFFQGHPEYDGAALFREYRRDSRRFLAGKRTNYPKMPRNYFDEETRTALAEFRGQAVGKPGIDLLTSFPEVQEERLVNAWHKFAVRIYANWLSYLVTQKDSVNHPPISELV